MESLALVLFILAVILQFNGLLCEKDCIGKEISKIHRLKRNHEQYKAINSTKNKDQDKYDIAKSKIEVRNKASEQTSPKVKYVVDKDESKEKDSKIVNVKEIEKSDNLRNSPPKIKHVVDKDEPKEKDSKIVNVKEIEKSDNLRNLQHSIEDIDEELPVSVKHVEINEHQLKEHTKPMFNNETSRSNKTIQKNEIENIPKKLLPKNTTQESLHVKVAKLKTDDTENNNKTAVKPPLDSNGDLSAQLVNKTKETKEKSVENVSKPSRNESDSKKQAPEDSIIEIKEHKYEEEIVRYYPTKACQTNIKRHWEASQDFNPQFSNSPYIQATNLNQGLTEADPYQRLKYNKENYLSASCFNLKDQSNRNYFYANFDVKPYNQANNRRIGGCICDKIRKNWLHRDTKIRKSIKSDEYFNTNEISYVTNNESHPY